MEFDFDASRDDLAKYINEPTELEVCDKTKAQRSRVWSAWESWTQGMRLDSRSVWIDFACSAQSAEGACKAFLRAYLKSYVKKMLVLGPEEMKTTRAINTGGTLEGIWAALVKCADMYVMEAKRQENVRDASFWSLNYNSRFKGSAEKPAYKIARWLPVLAREEGLVLGQTFDKIPATEEDVMQILMAIWVKAVDIPCSPLDRVGFHLAVLLGSIGGWRPASLLQVAFRDVAIGWLRDSNDSTMFIPIAHIVIHHVKQGDKIRRDQNDKLGFHITKVPCATICMLSLLVDLGIAAGAFKNEYTHPDQILKPRKIPDAEVSYIPVAWKEEFLDTEISSLTYTQLRKLWNRACLVLGLLRDMRLYSMRVGNAGRLNGVLEPSLRNFILSQSSSVFEKSYHPNDLQANLMKITFGTRTGDTDRLLEKTRHAFLQRDEGAPVYISNADQQEFESRDDIKKLRAKLSILPSKSAEADQIRSNITYKKNRLEQLLLSDRRQKYFQVADTLREQGLPTAHLQNPGAKDPHPRHRTNKGDHASRIGTYLVNNDAHPDFASMLLEYLMRPLNGTGQKQHICYLGCRQSFASKPGLTQHVNRSHATQLQKPFFCPECQRLRRNNALVKTGLAAWSNHVAQHHGRAHAPHAPRRESWCFLCEKLFTEIGLRRHLETGHHRIMFQSPFPCPECRKQGRPDVVVNGAAGWRLHVEQHHNDKCGAGQDGVKWQGRTPNDQREVPTWEKKKLASSDLMDEDSDDVPESCSHWSSAESARPASPDPHAGEEYWVAGW